MLHLATSKRLLAGLGVAAVLLIILALLNAQLQTGFAPQGMISLELAGSADRVGRILGAWGSGGITLAVAIMLLEFLFIPMYVLTLLMLTAHWTEDRPGVRERNLARWVKALFVAAGGADLTENVLILTNLSAPSDTLSLATTFFSLMKFTGLIIGIAGVIVLRAARRHPLTPSENRSS